MLKYLDYNEHMACTLVSHPKSFFRMETNFHTCQRVGCRQPAPGWGLYQPALPGSCLPLSSDWSPGSQNLHPQPSISIAKSSELPSSSTGSSQASLTAGSVELLPTPHPQQAMVLRVLHNALPACVPHFWDLFPREAKENVGARRDSRKPIPKLTGWGPPPPACWSWGPRGWRRVEVGTLPTLWLRVCHPSTKGTRTENGRGGH